MPFTFSESEREDLKNLRDRARADTEKGISGSYAAAYLYIANRLTKQDSIVGFPLYSPAERDPDVKQAALWFAGAAQVNAGKGIFSRLIRDFSIRQGALRYADYTSTIVPLMQKASNQVAENAINDILSRGGNDQLFGEAEYDQLNSASSACQEHRACR